MLDNLSAFLDDTTRPIVIAGAAAVYIVLWIFVAGGIIDRYARDRATRAYGFFAASGEFFFRFLRLGAVAVDRLCACCSARCTRWLFDTLYPRLTHEMTVERTAFLLRARAVCWCSACWSPRRRCSSTMRRCARWSRIGAACSARSAPPAASSAATRARRSRLFLINFGVFAVVLAVYALVAPGAAGGGLTMWLGVAMGQVYVLARLWIKLTFWASETALFQGRLGHAGYVGASRAGLARLPCGRRDLRIRLSAAFAITALMPSASSDSTTSSSSAIARTALRFLAMICRAVS